MGAHFGVVPKKISRGIVSMTGRAAGHQTKPDNIMKKPCSFGVSLLSLSVFLTACATKQAITSAGGEPLSLEQYQAVVVSDFGDKATPPGTDTRHQDSRDQVRSAGRTFADLIASEIRKTQSFQEVVREGTPASSTLL